MTPLGRCPFCLQFVRTFRDGTCMDHPTRDHTGAYPECEGARWTPLETIPLDGEDSDV